VTARARPAARRPLPHQRSFHGRRAVELSAVQRVIREQDHVWGRDLVDVGMRVAVARAAGRQKRAETLVSEVRLRRRDAVVRIADTLLAAATSTADLAACVRVELGRASRARQKPPTADGRDRGRVSGSSQNAIQ
jgi:hypothetical protein